MEQGHVFCLHVKQNFLTETITTVPFRRLFLQDSGTDRDNKTLSPSYPEFSSKHAPSGGTIIERCDTCFNQRPSVNIKYPNKYTTYTPEAFHSMVQPPMVKGKQARDRRP